MLQRFICLLIAFSATFWGGSVMASSPSEPAFKTQLASCFEPHRDTGAIRSLETWLAAGKSVYPNYNTALSISMNCMRSVCGVKNPLCCNTYCSMFGLTGNERDICVNKCTNPNGY
ncbi:hypothetical protein ACDW_15400 [Acidovorax sp. DW039]|nr:hypothetical protein ACDW_15400 [Acidovorax sp. DW039]